MESQFRERLEAAIAEETSELRGQLADAAAKLEAADRKVAVLSGPCSCPWVSTSFDCSVCCAYRLSQCDQGFCPTACRYLR